MPKQNTAACSTKKTSIGGQALIEGVMMRGPHKTAMAVRHVSGNIVTEEWESELSNRPRFWKIPFFRGLYGMVDSLRCGYKALMRSAELAGLEESEEKPASAFENALMSVMMVLSTVVGVALALGLFMYLPSLLYKLLAGALDNAFHTEFWQESAVMRGIFEGIIRLILFLLYLVVITLMKDIRRVFMYHGAEHKTIFCYENGEELTVENVRRQSRFHPRCGTSFLAMTLLIGIVISICIQIKTVWLRVLVKIALLPLTVGIGYEFIKLAGRKNNRFVRILSAPGLWIQRLTTREPDDDMIECAIMAFLPVIPDDPKADEW
ncbi:MAG: DUF1385 domain-containing protein [Clostridia bacterium]|nr:DUF1385 domain-containing protein [Clostridia bacterium]